MSEPTEYQRKVALQQAYELIDNALGDGEIPAETLLHRDDKAATCAEILAAVLATYGVVDPDDIQDKKDADQHNADFRDGGYAKETRGE